MQVSCFRCNYNCYCIHNSHFSFLSEWTTVSATVGNLVSLYCRNESLNSLSQLTWTKDTTKLVTFASPTQMLHWDPEAYSLQINMSLSKDNLYSLVMYKVQQFHAGNYTCETATASGFWEMNWTLVVAGMHFLFTK